MSIKAYRFLLNRMNGIAQKTKLGDIVTTAGFNDGYSDYYYVDAAVPSSGSGLSWDSPKKTIKEALDLARYTRGTTTINSDKKRHAYVLVAPGQYNEQILWSGYNIHLIGIQPLGNIDYGVVINYTGAVATTAVMAFSGAGCSIENIQINCTEAIPALYLSIFDGCLLKNVRIKGDGTNCTYGIYGCNIKSSVIEDCFVENCGIGISVGNSDGGDTYFHNSEINNCKVVGSGTVGIQVASTAVCTLGSFIHQNRVAGAYTVGIYQDAAAAKVMMSDNWVMATGAVTDDGSGEADNHTAS